jgi:hypothetical protein
MTPWHHAVSSAAKFGGNPEDYINIHEWFDETKSYTGDWTHRVLRHHAAGVQWCIEKFGQIIPLGNQRFVPVKLVAELHIEEDCGFIPTVAHWLGALRQKPEKWMLSAKKTCTKELQIEE